jgi:hypothetical protein
MAEADKGPHKFGRTRAVWRSRKYLPNAPRRRCGVAEKGEHPKKAADPAMNSRRLI